MYYGLWCPSPLVRRHHITKNERVQYIPQNILPNTPTTPRPSLHKDTLLAPSHLACVPELSSLVYIFIYLNFPHLTTFYFPPNNRGDLGPRPFSHSPAPLIQHGHSALLLLSSSVWTTRIFVFGMRESPFGRLELSRSAFHLCHTKLDEQTYIWLLAYLLCVYVICGS